MTGFLEEREEDGKKYYFKSPLLTTPESKIKWNDLISETKDWVEEYWPEISQEYIERYCQDIDVTDPFTGETVNILADAPSASSVEVVGGDWPDMFKSKEDYRWVVENEWDEVGFLLNAKGDYGKEEVEEIKSWKHREESG
jgi:hypothetical protein